MLGAGDGGEEGRHVCDACGIAAALHGPVQVLLLDRLQQVVHTVYLESLDGITVVGCGHYYLCIDIDLPEDAETVTVRKLHVHEYDIGGMFLQPLDRAADGTCHADDFQIRIIFLQSAAQVGLCHRFVFDYQYF